MAKKFSVLVPAEGCAGIRPRPLQPHSNEGHQGRVPQTAGHQVRLGHGQEGLGGQHDRAQLWQKLLEACANAQVSLLELAQQEIPCQHHHSGGHIENVTRLGDLLPYGQLFKPCGNNYIAQISHILGNFCKKIVEIVKSFLGNFYRFLATFTGHTGLKSSKLLIGHSCPYFSSAEVLNLACYGWKTKCRRPECCCANEGPWALETQ